MIEQRLIMLRKKIRRNGKRIVDTLIDNHAANICIICGSNKGLTKEHVIPKWTFENNPKKYFVTDVNGLRQEYIKTTLPACSECNSYVLGVLERHLELKFRQANLNQNSFDYDDLEKIILWLELIDYKFQILNLKRKFKKPSEGQFIPFLADMPVSIMQDIDLSPYKIFSTLRSALKKLSVKSKATAINSLVVFKTKNESFYFFHKTNEFIFIELASYRVAFFYFFNQRFKSEYEAYAAAWKIISEVYQ
jgi:hypothetical protein